MEGSESNETISLADTRQRMGTDANILDIRSDEEWQKVGNIPGAIQANEDEAADVAGERIDEDHTVIVVCEDGERSARVAEQLREAGRDAVALEGGMAAWADKSLPMQPTEDPALASDPGSVEDETSDPEDFPGGDSDEDDAGDAGGNDEDASDADGDDEDAAERPSG
jgi:rhodanese-related sulfurtransferase